MSRYQRHFEPEIPVHVVHRGNDRQSIFRDDGDFLAFRRFIAEALPRTNAFMHSYVLMPNHVHLLLSAHEGQAISRFVHRVARRYAVYANTCYGRTGTLWEGRFRSSIIKSDRYLFACHRYIDLNPVRAGLVSRPADYPWSSYAHHAGLRQDSLVTAHPLIELMGPDSLSRAIAYRALFEQAPAPDEVAALRTGISSSAVKVLERCTGYRFLQGQGTARSWEDG